MKFYAVPGQIKKINRIRQIGGTLARYQLVATSRRIWEYNPVAIVRRLIQHAGAPSRKKPEASSIRRVLEELGTTYIKFGQWLSVRPDFVPPDVIEELEKLQDRLPVVSFKIIKRAIEEETGKDLYETFSELDAEPISTASIAQVHKGILRSGEVVAVKVQHPGLKQRIEIDLSILQSVAEWAVENWPHLSLHRPEDLINSFRAILMDEVDFMVEAKNQNRIARMFDQTPWAHIPKVYWEHTTSRLLVMEFLEGFKITHHGISRNGADPKLLARRLSNCFFRQIFEYGVFHSDPHPGNILFMPNNHIGVVDFGIVSKFDSTLLNRLIDWFYAAIYRDVDLFAETFLAVGTPMEVVDKAHFRSDCMDYLDEMHFQPANRISFAKLLATTNRLLYRHKISAPPTFMFFFKAISTLEGVARRVDPEFDWRHHWGPKLKEVIEGRYSPEAIARDQWKLLRSYNRLVSEYPDDVREIIRNWKDGSFKIQLSGFRDYVDTIRKGYSKLAFSIVLSSLIIGFFLLGFGQGVGTLRQLGQILPGISWVALFVVLMYLLFRRK